jgi:hypothetical protein
MFDVMEPERPKVGWAVLAFLKWNASHLGDFTIREGGGEAQSGAAEAGGCY